MYRVLAEKQVDFSSEKIRKLIYEIADAFHNGLADRDLGCIVVHEDTHDYIQLVEMVREDKKPKRRKAELKAAKKEEMAEVEELAQETEEALEAEVAAALEEAMAEEPTVEMEGYETIEEEVPLELPDDVIIENEPNLDLEDFDLSDLEPPEEKTS
ncbi:MAG: hypothetical protein ACUVXI_00235 [bacterium]